MCHVSASSQNVVTCDVTLNERNDRIPSSVEPLRHDNVDAFWHVAVVIAVLQRPPLTCSDLPAPSSRIPLFPLPALRLRASRRLLELCGRPLCQSSLAARWLREEQRSRQGGREITRQNGRRRRRRCCRPLAASNKRGNMSDVRQTRSSKRRRRQRLGARWRFEGESRPQSSEAPEATIWRD